MGNDSQLLGAQHTINCWLISRVKHIGATQMTLTLGRHFGENMAFESVFVLVSRGGFLKTLRRSTVYFSFWHNNFSAFASLADFLWQRRRIFTIK
jgi:hypothetical protein